MQNLPRFQKPKTAKIAQWLHRMLAAVNPYNVGRTQGFLRKDTHLLFLKHMYVIMALDELENFSLPHNANVFCISTNTKA